MKINPANDEKILKAFADVFEEQVASSEVAWRGTTGSYAKSFPYNEIDVLYESEYRSGSLTALLVRTRDKDVTVIVSISEYPKVP